MASLALKPRVPTINWSDPLTDNLIIDIPLYERNSTSVKELVRKVDETFAGAPFWNEGPFGAGVQFDGTDDGIISSTVTDLTTKKDNWSTQCMFKVGSTASEQVMINLSRVNDNGLNSIEIEGGLIKWLLNGVARVSTGVTPVVGNIYDVVLRRLSGTTQAFVNGIITSGTSTSNPDGQTVNNVNLGCARLNGSTLFRFFNGTVYLGRHWERALSENEVRQLYTNPWRIYKRNFKGGR